jgi:hypothetical protein
MIVLDWDCIGSWLVRAWAIIFNIGHGKYFQDSKRYLRSALRLCGAVLRRGLQEAEISRLGAALGFETLNM